MITFVQVIEMIDKPIKKIRGITETGEYVEVRMKEIDKDNRSSIHTHSLDIRMSKFEGESMRIIYHQNVIKELSLAEIIDFLGIKFIKEEFDGKETT